MMEVYVNGVSVIGPGLTERQLTLDILKGKRQWCHESLQTLKPSMLPSNERRRTTTLIKLALQALQDLLGDEDAKQSVSTVFATSDGDLEIADKMCQTLATEEKAVSPTVFHNSVYNAPAGYWSIAAALRGSSTSISAADATFMVGLMEAITTLLVEQGVVLYVAYDNPGPEPLHSKRPFLHPLAIALRLGIVAEAGALGSLRLSGQSDSPVSVCSNTSLETLRAGVPSGFGLPLLEALCRGAESSIALPYLSDKTYTVTVSH